MEQTPVELHYWKIRGLGQMIVTLLEYMNVPYNYTQYTKMEDFMALKTKKMEGGYLDLDLPMIIDPNNKDLHLSQSQAVMFYLANQYMKSLAPQTVEEYPEFMKIYSFATDLSRGMTTPAYKNKVMADFQKSVEGTMKWYKFKIAFFVNLVDNGKWIMGDKLTVNDFIVAETIERMATLQTELKMELATPEQFKVLKAYLDRFNSLPRIKAFRESERYLKRPFNSPVAIWG